MTPREFRQLVRSLRYGAEEVAELTNQIYDYMAQVYQDTLAELAHQHGYQLDGDIVLSEDVLATIREHARGDANRIVETHNRDLESQLEALRPLDPEAALGYVSEWLDGRVGWKADQISTTAAYAASADATLAFFGDNGAEPEFDFGGHGDAAPACPICQALVAANPHGYEDVIRIGTPHPNCAQEWHARPADLPDEIVLGVEPAGVLLTDPLAIREPQAKALDFIANLGDSPVAT